MSNTPPPAPAANFIRNIIDEQNAAGKWGGRVETRFPPEPNGYLHLGHAKSIFLNFGLARDYNGVCHLRFDDTNPEKESQEYVDAITESVKWLGFDWGKHLYFASNYFDTMYACAEHLIQAGHAYVDSLTADEMRTYRGTLTEPGKDSPYRSRSADENLALFRSMRAGEFADGTHVLRAKIDMASPNINLRDPAIYRIKRAHHHNTGDTWCIYPMYTYAHPIEDAIEHITHSICTLEFEDQRPFYDWLLNKLADGGFFTRPLPQQIEFARLNLTYVVLSKRKLIQLVEEKHVSGWDDPRLPTLVGARRRGYTAEGLKRFTDQIGVTKSDSLIDYSVFEECQRDVLNETAPRRIAVLDPLKLIIDNYAEDQEEECFAPNHPQKPEFGKRPVPFSRELWIEREDFVETPPKGYFRLFPGNKVRLRYGFVIECAGCDKDDKGNVVAVHCNYFADSKSGTPGADNYKVKGNIHWLSAKQGYLCEVRLFDRLFRTPQPGSEGRDFLLDINPYSVQTLAAYIEPTLQTANPGDAFQFERYGYFVADRVESQPGKPIFNRTVTLKDSWIPDGSAIPNKGDRPMPKITEVDDELYLEDEQVEDEVIVEYDIAINNSDLNLEVIDNMWKKDEIKIPEFQREFVWDIRQASLLIESFLLGLPVPQVFFHTDDVQRNLVIDGQQRIKSILYFFEGYFGSETTQSKRQVFRLQGLSSRSPYAGKRFVDLDEVSQRKLRSATLRAVIVRQLKPSQDSTSIYHIFERLNTGGTALKPQEIRNCVFRGDFMNLLRKLNRDPNWRKILGKNIYDKHQKDVELILRIFGLSEHFDEYEKPMKEFLNKTMKKEQAGDSDRVMRFAENFPKAVALIVSTLGEKPFHIRGPLNSSALDAVLCTIIGNLDRMPNNIGNRWRDLKENQTFKDATYYGTSDVAVVRSRFGKAHEFLIGTDKNPQ